MLSPPLDSPFSPLGCLYLLPLPSLLYSTLWISLLSGRWRTLRKLITGWICLSPFDSPLYPPGHLYLLPPSSLLCITLWTSLSGPDCGAHIRKWLLASFLSPLLIPPQMATHSSVLAWRIPGMGEPSGLPSMGSHRVGHDWRDLAAAPAAKWIV